MSNRTAGQEPRHRNPRGDLTLIFRASRGFPGRYGKDSVGPLRAKHVIRISAETVARSVAAQPTCSPAKWGRRPARFRQIAKFSRGEAVCSFSLNGFSPSPTLGFCPKKGRRVPLNRGGGPPTSPDLIQMSDAAPSAGGRGRAAFLLSGIPFDGVVLPRRLVTTRDIRSPT